MALDHRSRNRIRNRNANRYYFKLLKLDENKTC